MKRLWGKMPRRVLWIAAGVACLLLLAWLLWTLGPVRAWIVPHAKWFQTLSWWQTLLLGLWAIWAVGVVPVFIIAYRESRQEQWGVLAALFLSLIVVLFWPFWWLLHSMLTPETRRRWVDRRTEGEVAIPVVLPPASEHAGQSTSLPPAHGDTWASMVQRLVLSPPAWRLASRCTLIAISGTTVKLALDRKDQNLVTEAAEGDLKQALSHFFGQPTQLEFLIAADGSPPGQASGT
jgi:hypothetical protein